jgi:predicted transglutaminase-like cysteine proteinase
MLPLITRKITRLGAAGLVLAAAMCGPVSAAPVERVLYSPVGEETRPPIGWLDFCNDHPKDCAAQATSPRDVVLSAAAWRDLVRINKYVNTTIRPITDMEQWGVVEKWSYPDTGLGDCEDYVLLKRRLLIEAGWAREALLITVVRDKKGDGHAVLTVRTNRGEFILDNQETKILPWTETGYRFVKRQSQSNPNVWVMLSHPRPATATATSR